MIENYIKYIPGVQLALFEIVWPIYDWIESIYISKETDNFYLHVVIFKSKNSIFEEEKKKLNDSIEGIFSEINDGVPLKIDFSSNDLFFGKANYIELINDDIFHQIAKEVAPWRLDQGR